MKTNYFYCISILLLFQYSFGQVVDELKAFPSAEGFGKYSVGGRTETNNGNVYKVINLNNSGSGSLRNALAQTDPGYVIFDVAGYIGVNYPRIDPTDDKTILGQSAFRNGGEGITIRMGSTVHQDPLMGNAFGNHIMRYMRFRRGQGIVGEPSGDNYTPYNTSGSLMIDHCSFMFGTDQNVSFPSIGGGYTIQYSISAFGLMYSTHQYGVAHSKGSLTSDTDKISWNGNLFANNDDRNPLLAAKGTGITQSEIVNNFFYNRGTFGLQFTGQEGNREGIHYTNVIGNFWKNGPNSSVSRWGFLWPDVPTGTYFGNPYLFPQYQNHRFFVKDNLGPRRSSGQPEVNIVGTWHDGGPVQSASTDQIFTPHDFPIQESTAITSSTLETDLLSHVGAKWNNFRDVMEEKAVSDAINNTGALYNGIGYTNDGHPQYNTLPDGGYPNLSAMTSSLSDTNNNGIEDSFEVSGATFPNGVQIPSEIVLTGSHNQVLPFYIKASTGEAWYNPGYELIEVRYFNDQDIEAMTWVPQDPTNCTAESIIPEYQLDGVWNSGENILSVDEGTAVVLSMLPNNIGLTITLPDGTTVGDDYNLGSVTSANNGTYLLTSAEGCETTLELTVTSGNDEIVSVDTPKSVARGSTTNVAITYSASTARDIYVAFRSSASPYTLHQSTVVSVGAGSGTVQIPIAVPSDVPVANYAYRYQILLLPTGQQGWNNKLDAAYVTSVSVTDGAPPTGTDEIVSVNTPIRVDRGSTTNVSVAYSASTARDISVAFKLASSPWTTYQTSVVSVGAGSGTVQVPIAVPSDVPVANYSYRYQILLLPTGQQGYNNSLDQGYISSISVTDNLSSTAFKASLDFQNLVENNQLETISVVPNPGTNAVNVLLPLETEYTSYNLYSLNGAVVKTGSIAKNQREVPISVYDIEDGLYLLNLSNNEGDMEYVKIIKD